MIWLGPGSRDQYSLITGRIANENDVIQARFSGEAGTNGVPVSLYRIDTVNGSRTRVSTRRTGDWMGSQGRYYFASQQPGLYQVKIDSLVCLVDTLKFSRDLWSDTLVIVGGETLDQGMVITQDCIKSSNIPVPAEPDAFANSEQLGNVRFLTDSDWKVFPNPAQGYLQIEIENVDLLNFRLFDALGKTIQSGTFHGNQSINLQGMKPGIYGIQVYDQMNILGTKKVLLME